MHRRGCHPRVLSALHGLHEGLHHVFRLRGAVGEWWIPVMAWCKVTLFL